MKEERAKMERVLGEREKETDRRMQNDRIARLEDEVCKDAYFRPRFLGPSPKGHSDTECLQNSLSAHAQ